MTIPGFLVDTNVLSELRRPNPCPGVLEFLGGQAADDLYVCEVTLAEIRFGAELRQVAAERATILSWLDEIIRPLFADRCLRSDEDAWLTCKLLEYEARRKRVTYPQPDLVIAAIALRHGLTVVTRDDKPFLQAGAPVLNPWKKSGAG